MCKSALAFKYKEIRLLKLKRMFEPLLSFIRRLSFPKDLVNNQTFPVTSTDAAFTRVYFHVLKG